MAPLPKLVWFAEHEPATFAAVRRWAGIKELVIARLTGTWAVDHSIASGTGLLNLHDARLGPRGARHRGHRRRPALAARARPPQRLALGAAPAADLGLEAGLRGDRRRRRRAAGQPRPRRGAPRRGRLLDRHQRRAAADGRAPRGRSPAAGLLLRADAGALGRRRRDQQRRRRAALGRRGARARPRPPRRSAAARAGRAGAGRQRGAAHAALPALRARPALELGGRAAPTSGSPATTVAGTSCARRSRASACSSRSCSPRCATRATRCARSAPPAASRAAPCGARCSPTRWACRSASPPATRGRPSAPRCWRWTPSGWSTASTAPRSWWTSRTSSSPRRGAAGVYADLLPTFASLYDALAPAFRALERHR